MIDKLLEHSMWIFAVVIVVVFVAAGIGIALSPPDHYCRDLKQLADQGNQLAQVQLVKDCR